MRIIYLHQYFNTPGMVGITRSYEMARRLVRMGHEVHMITSDRTSGGRGWRVTEESGIQVHWCGVPYSNRMSYARRIQAFFQFAWAAGQRAARLPADVIFATSTPLTIALPAVRAARRQGIPMVFEVRDLWPETPIAMGALRGWPLVWSARRLERFAYENAAHVVALSPDMKTGVTRTGYPAERVTVIPNSSDIELFNVPGEEGKRFRRQHAWLGDRPLVVYTGVMGRVNGVDYLARLAAAVRPLDPEVRFLVIGDGCEQGKVRAEARRLGVLDETFFLLPPVPKREMPAVLSAADVATSTVIDREALWANSANKVFDGMAAGRAIAINHEGWLADLIRRTGCGLVLPYADLDRAAAALVGLVRDRAQLGRAQAAAQRLARDHFNRNHLAVALEAVLQGVLPDARWRAAA